LVTLLDRTTARTTWNREGRRLTSVRYQIRNNRRQFLKLKLPESAELWSASVAGRAVQPAQAPDGRVMIPLIRSQEENGALAGYELEVVYVEDGPAADRRGRGTFRAELPAADVPSTYVAWTVHSPSRAKVRRRSYDGTLEHVDELAPPLAAPAHAAPPEDEALEKSAEEDMDFDQVELADNVQQMPSEPAPQVKALTLDRAGAGVEPGAAPVLVSFPAQGPATYFEKTLALTGPLQIEFRYRGLGRKP
jgi:hypothetical protein